MSETWLQRLLESKADKQRREFEELHDKRKQDLDELSKSQEFKDMLRKEATDIIAEGKRKEKERVESEKKRHIAQVAEARKNIEIISNDMRNSKEPFVNVLSMGFSPENGIEVKLDYNESFIRFLNSLGIKGANDDESIRLWLAHLNYDIGQESLAEDYLANGVSGDEMPPMGYAEMFGGEDDDEDDVNN
jgi:hypothetical protein